jgi:hypothetical protein
MFRTVKILLPQKIKPWSVTNGKIVGRQFLILHGITQLLIQKSRGTMHPFFYLGTYKFLLEATKTKTLLSPLERKINAGFIFLVEVRIIIKEKGKIVPRQRYYIIFPAKNICYCRIFLMSLWGLLETAPVASAVFPYWKIKHVFVQNLEKTFTKNGCNMLQPTAIIIIIIIIIIITIIIIIRLLMVPISLRTYQADVQFFAITGIIQLLAVNMIICLRN